MIEVGNIVRSKYMVKGHRARIGLVMKLTDRPSGTRSALAQVYWPHRRDFGWVKCDDMEVVDESR